MIDVTPHIKKLDIGSTMKKKKLFLNDKKTKWCIVQLYNHKYDMQQAYIKYCKQRGQKPDPILGASTHYEKIYIGDKGKEKLSGETGTVFLCAEHCGAGLVAHELLHAVLYAWKHKLNKEQYPITIKNMDEEEEILRNLTFAISQFYQWFYNNTNSVEPAPTLHYKLKQNN